MSVNANIMQLVTEKGIYTRPKASPGLWLMALIPLSLLMSGLNHQAIITATYKLSLLFSVGLICSCLICLYCYGFKTKSTQVYVGLTIAGLLVALLFHLVLGGGIPFSIWSGLMCTLIYHTTFVQLLKKLPYSFSLGEAAIVSQGIVLFVYHAAANIHESCRQSPANVIQKSTLVIQIGLLTIMAIAYVSYLFKIQNPFKFYMVFVTISTCMLLIILHHLLQTDPFLWIGLLILEDFYTHKIVLFWSMCSIVAIVLISRHIKATEKASTALRKIFHVLAVVTYMPGLMYNCSFLYLASGVVLGIFLFLELLRILKIPPLGTVLQQGLYVYVDDKDAGITALTPIYLLVGVSLPLWLHPAPCDITNSATLCLLPLLSGLLSIGVGDTAASIVGSKLGKHRWSNGTNKTVEGTIACILSQAVAVVLLIISGHLENLSMSQEIRTIIGVIVTSTIEAATDQVDNLVLPLVMYIFVI